MYIKIHVVIKFTVLIKAQYTYNTNDHIDIR